MFKNENKRNDKGENRKPFNERSSNRDSFINFSINIGRKNGVSPIELISLVNRALKSNEIEIGGIDIRESYTIFEIDGSIKNDLIKKIPKIDFNGNSLSIKQTEEKVEKRFLKEKKKKTHSSGRRNRNNSDRDYNTKGNFRNKRKNKRKNKRF